MSQMANRCLARVTPDRPALPPTSGMSAGDGLRSLMTQRRHSQDEKRRLQQTAIVRKVGPGRVSDSLLGTHEPVTWTEYMPTRLKSRVADSMHNRGFGHLTAELSNAKEAPSARKSDLSRDGAGKNPRGPETMAAQSKSGRPAQRSRERRWHQTTLAVLWLLSLALTAREAYWHGSAFALWDWMLLSGLFVFLFGAYVAYSLPQRLERTLAGLIRRQVLVAHPGSIRDVNTALREERIRWRLVGGLVCSLAIALAYAAVLITSFSFDQLAFGILEAVIAFPAGRYLGAMAQCSTLSRALVRHGFEIVVRPTALDSAGGLEAIGHFFFLQASVVSLPALYLSVWLLLIPAFPRYEGWLLPYCGLLVVALIFTMLAFVLPVWAFHKEMQRQKDAYAARTDEIAGRVNTLNDKLMTTRDQEARRRLRAEVDAETKLYREIEAMPLWPVASATRRRFTINNTLLTFPLVVRGLGQLGAGGDFLHWLASQFSA